MAGVDWKEELRGKTADQMWISIRGFVRKLMAKFIPWKRRKTSNDPPWMDGEVRRCIAEKGRAWKKWKETKKWKDKEEYQRNVTETKKRIRQKKNAHERKVAECRKTNPRMFYAFVNRAKKTRNKIGPLVDGEGNVVVEPGEQANVLNKQYASVFNRSGDGVQ